MSVSTAAPTGQTRPRSQSIVVEEKQHLLVKAGLQHGHLIHPSLLGDLATIQAIAHVGCRSGVWLNDVSRSHFTHQKPAPRLTGFDTLTSKFTPLREPGVELVEYDPRLPFADEWLGKYDLVNVSMLVYTVTEEDFRKVVANAVTLLKPGGHLQWFESELRNITPLPAKPEILRTLDLVNQQRRATGLVTYSPTFMLQTLLSIPKPLMARPDYNNPPLIDIVHFEQIKSGSPQTARDLRLLILSTFQMLLRGSREHTFRRLSGSADWDERDKLEKERNEKATLDAFLEEEKKSGETTFESYCVWALGKRRVRG